jgi:outer membrane protein insertion porin family
MKKILLLFIVIFLQSINAQENYIVRDIDFTGNNTLEDSKLLELMTHYSTSWFSDYIFFNDSFLFSSDIFASDKENIIREYQRNGFIKAQIINVDLKKDEEDKTLEI